MKEKDVANLVKTVLIAAASFVASITAFKVVFWLAGSMLFRFLVGIPAMFAAAYFAAKFVRNFFEKQYGK